MPEPIHPLKLVSLLLQYPEADQVGRWTDSYFKKTKAAVERYGELGGEIWDRSGGETFDHEAQLASQRGVSSPNSRAVDFTPIRASSSAS